MSRAIACLAWLLALVATPLPALTPRDVARVDVTRAAARLPLDAAFTDEQARHVTLRGYVAARPAILALGYYGCSNLCGVLLEGLRASLARAGLAAGRDAEIVVVSIAPLETPADARRREASLFSQDASAASGWHFLTGTDAAIASLTTAAGYTYAYDAPAAQYAHPAGILVVGEDGHVRARLPGVAFAPAALRAALASDAPAEASGRWLLCFHDALASGRYTGAAMTAVRLGALGTLVILGAVMLRARWRSAHRGAASGRRA